MHAHIYYIKAINSVFAQVCLLKVLNIPTYGLYTSHTLTISRMADKDESKILGVAKSYVYPRFFVPPYNPNNLHFNLTRKRFECVLNLYSLRICYLDNYTLKGSVFFLKSYYSPDESARLKFGPPERNHC